MRKISLLLLIFCCLSVICSFDNCFAKGYPYDLKEYYPLGSADIWNYATVQGEEKVQGAVKVSGASEEGGINSVVLDMNGQSSDYMLIDNEGIKQYKSASAMGYTTYSPPRVVYPYLMPQEKKTYDFQRTYFHAIRNEEYLNTNSYEVTLDSVNEIVEVPAGTFANCLKYSSIFQSKRVNTEEYKQILVCTTWLASGVGLVKSACNSTDKYQEPPVENQNFIVELESANINGVEIAN